MKTCVMVMLGLLIAAPAMALEPGEPANKAACVQALAPRGGTLNDLTNLQAKADEAKTATPNCLYIPSGTYRVVGDLHFDSIYVVGNGNASHIYNPYHSNRKITLDGDGAGIYNIKISTTSGPRTDTDEAIWIGDTGLAQNIVVHNVTIYRGDGPGIITYGCQYCRITSNNISYTRADAIHINGDSRHVYVGGNRIDHAGDDKVALVKYESTEFPDEVLTDIMVENNRSTNGDWGRGVTVLGATDVTVRGNEIIGEAWACYLIEAEEGEDWTTLSTQNVWLYDNWAENCGLDAQNNQAAFQVMSTAPFYMVEDVYLEHGNVINPPAAGDYVVEVDNVNNISCFENATDWVEVSPANCTGDPDTVTGSTVDGTLLGGTAKQLPAN